MTLEQALNDGAQAVQDFNARVRECAEIWDTPRGPGKWSPAQVTEHVAMVLEDGAQVVLEQPSRLPTVPFGLRWLARALFLRKTIQKGRFPKARATRAMSPLVGPASTQLGAQRVQLAWEAFRDACTSSAAQGPTFKSSAFGKIGIWEYVRFQELHTRHHQKQLTVERPDRA